MRRIGILSDIHGHLPALEAALRELEAASADSLVCCGDIIGIGPWPHECVARIRASADLCVLGNHESALLRGSGDPQLETASRQLTTADLEYLASLPETVSYGDLALVHGSFRSPMVEFVVDSAAAAASFDAFATRIGIHGHTHVQTLFSRRHSITEGGAIGVGHVHRIDPASRVLVNPGSVGMCPFGAAYGLLDLTEETVSFSVAPYDSSSARSHGQQSTTVFARSTAMRREETDGSR